MRSQILNYIGRKSDRVVGTRGKGTMAECIPPSAVFTIYPVLADVSIGGLFIAAINKVSPTGMR